MSEIHKKIVREIVEEEKLNQNTEGILLFGSVAKNQEKSNSDIDIIIITKSGEWSMENKERYGIKIDFEYCPKEIFFNRVNNYPFLGYILLGAKAEYDPQGIINDSIKEIEEYFKNNKEVAKFWQDNWRIKNKLKLTGQDKGFTTKRCDEAEILFSKAHKVTRNFFRN